MFSRSFARSFTRMEYLGALTTVAAVPFIYRSVFSSNEPPKEEPTLFLNQDPSTAFASRSTLSLLRSLLVFQACQVEALVDYTPVMIETAKTLHLSSPFFWIVKQTFFNQFCGGETSDDVIPVIQRLNGDGIGSILDLSVESDIGSGSLKDETQRIEKVMELVKDCITTAAYQPGTFVAVKVTALGSSQSLQSVSGVIGFSRDLFKSVQSEDGHLDQKSFGNVVSSLPGGNSLGDVELQALFDLADSNKDGLVDWTDFIRVVNVGETPKLFTGSINFENIPQGSPQSVSSKYLPSTTPEDINEIRLIETRLASLCNYAVENKVKLMFDAEQSYFQPAIHYLSNKMMEKYNRYEPGQKPTANVYNTYQLYLKEGLFKAKSDFESAAKSPNNYVFAAKLVRGAYMISERKRAQVLNLRDPINESIEDTHASYNEAVSYLLLNSAAQTSLVIASHNRHSIAQACDKMQKANIDPKSGEIMFAQLYGMHDHTTYTLAQKGYLVAKYLPYGPIEDVIPYLLRRAQENRSMLAGKNGDLLSDRYLLWRELKSRVGLFQ